MKAALVFILILGFCLIKRENHSCFISFQHTVRNGSAPRYPLKNISNSNHRRSPVDLFAVTACCDDDDDFEHVKKKTGSTVSFLLNVFEEGFAPGKLKQIQHPSKYVDHFTQPVYIFQRELLI